MKLITLITCSFFTTQIFAQKVDADNTVLPDRPVISCPVTQTKVANGSKPNIELFKKIVQCWEGEYPAPKHYDGAINVDIINMEFGKTRPWTLTTDDANGGKGTIVYPVKVTYTIKQFYRKRTSLESNTIRQFNFYVNVFGVWEIGSQQLIKKGELSDITIK
jgi:hypothetical protein